MLPTVKVATGCSGNIRLRMYWSRKFWSLARECKLTWMADGWPSRLIWPESSSVRITASMGSGNRVSFSPTVKVISEPSPTTYDGADVPGSSVPAVVGVVFAAAAGAVVGAVVEAGSGVLAGPDETVVGATPLVGASVFVGPDGTGVGSTMLVGSGALAAAGGAAGASTRSGSDNSPLSASPWPTSPPPSATAAIRNTGAAHRSAVGGVRSKSGTSAPDNTKAMAANGTAKDINRSSHILPTTARTTAATKLATRAAT